MFLVERSTAGNLLKILPRWHPRVSFPISMACEAISAGPTLHHTHQRPPHKYNQNSLYNIQILLLIRYPRGYPIMTSYGQAHLFRLFHRLFRRYHALHCDTRAQKLLENQKGAMVYLTQVPSVGLKPDSPHRFLYKTHDRQELCRAPSRATTMTEVESRAWREQHQPISMARCSRGGLSLDQLLRLYQCVH